MSLLYFLSPPLPHYIASGVTRFRPGDKHVNRHNIGIFDLLVVSRGCLYMAEEDQEYEVSEGHALILRPDRHHYPTQECREDTDHFWLHFGVSGSWGCAEHPGSVPQAGPPECKSFTPQTFHIQVPQFAALANATMMMDTLRQLTELEAGPYHTRTQWNRQILFQQVLERLNDSIYPQQDGSGAHIADQAAAYLRHHYRDDITAESLGEALNFHPVYIARCMQKEWDCSPFEFLTRYRLEQAKLLLLQTDLPVARIAEEVGFHQASYFSSSFVRYEGLSPRAYRKRFCGEGLK